ncbi:MAG: methylmalonyl Co-A mutase-associated GTPase MeaB, partial [Bacteroidales bacterium]|nr:methylmalonyl Co-A mutase-associated GTPase MeaB [Bacteroidales bacterium]
MTSKKKTKNSALHVKKGIDPPPQVNKDAAERFSSIRADNLETKEYVQGILDGNRTLLSKAITLVESALPKHHALAQEIISGCLPHAGKSIRVGITGVPGVGKSTFIEALGKHLTSSGHKVAVLAIDPSSSRSKGSILGDKTRMEDLANDPDAFIRPSASSGSLGGVARKTREAIILCEAAGFDCIFVETVGVGQSETAVHSMVDFFLLLMLAGAGDELQGIKRGIMEMADAIVINKADGTNIQKAELAQREYKNALHLYPATVSGWEIPVETCSAIQNLGITDIWGIIERYRSMMTGDSDYFYLKRREQTVHAMYDSIDRQLKDRFFGDDKVKQRIKELEKKVLAGKMSAYQAAGE